MFENHFRSIGHFGCLKFTFDSNFGHFRSMQIFVWPFQIYTDFNNFAFLAISDRSAILVIRKSLLIAFLAISDRYPPFVLDWTTMSIIKLFRDIWMNNACVKFEERSLNFSKVIALTTKL